ncbi:MAG: hypothetical protein [Microvirus sp.]|nr:MAG: hypothetical protein [Microvirus sp.]
MHTFDLYFSSIVAFQYHPANPATSRISLEECAAVALQCIAIRNRIAEEQSWPSSLPA